MAVNITAPVPKETSEQVSAIADRAMTSDYGQETMPEMPKMDFSVKGTPSQFKGFDNEALLGAIESRALRGTRAEMARQRSQNTLEAVQMRLSRLTNAAALVNQEHKINEQARLNKYLMEQNRKRARAQTLGNILGIVGAGAGLVATGGNAAGAMAGYQMGQGVGQSGMVGG